MKYMKLISWNVNGIRAALKKDFLGFLESEDPDVICLQETKARPEQVDLKLENYHMFWNSAEKKGYSGTAIFSKIKPLNVTNGIGMDRHDTEGRVITAEYDKFFLVTVYTPNSKRGLLRLEYRVDWDQDFLNYVKKLEDTKPVIFCGDLNVAHKEIDLKNPHNNSLNPGFTIEEREGFDNIESKGFVDTFRHFYPDKIQYSWWSYMHQARTKNIGWRLDYFCTSNILNEKLKDAVILDQVLGSDHCPVKLTINL